MGVIDIPRPAALQIQGHIWARNGKTPDASFQQQLVQAANQCARWRVKELARFGCSIASLPTSAGSGNRWRFACHTSPRALFIFSRAHLAPALNDVDTPSPGARLRMVNGAGTTIGDATHRFGASDGTSPDTPAHFGGSRMPLLLSGAVVEVPPMTDLYGTFTDLAGGRILSATVYEVSQDSDTANDYLPTGWSAGQSIFDEDRGDMVEVARDLWKRGASPVWHWSSNTDATAPETIDNTYRNLIDDSSTTVIASAPGATLALSNRSRKGLSTVAHGGGPGVPCIMKVYAKTDSGTGGGVKLLNSATTLATCSGFTSTPSWVSSSVLYLSASSLKHDIHYSHTGLALGVGLTVYAVSIYQYEA